MPELTVFALAQDNQAQPPAPGEMPAGTATPGTPATTPAGAGGSPFGGDFLLIICLMVGVMLVFSIMGQRRDRKKREAMISSIKKHDRVQTIGGVIGSVVEVKLITDRETGRPRGFGFVEMGSQEEADAAIRALNGQPFGGRPLTVNEARERERTGGGGGYGGGGGRGGYGGGGRGGYGGGY